MSVTYIKLSKPPVEQSAEKTVEQPLVKPLEKPVSKVVTRRSRYKDGQGYLRGRHVNTPKVIDKPKEQRYDATTVYRCSYCKDTHRVLVINDCDCEGKDKHCRFCHGTNAIRSTIPCQDCKIKDKR